MDIVAPVAAAAAATRSGVRDAKAGALKAATRRPPVRMTVVAAALVLIAGGAFWFSRTHTTAGEAQQTAALKSSVPAGVSPASKNDGLVPPHDSTAVATKPSHKANHATTPTMNASSSDNSITPMTDSNPAAPGSEKHAVPVKQAVPPPATAAATHAPAPKPARAAPVEQGSLSVYFLGGVGDVWIDGALFPHQPPFEKAPLAAGKHRVSCRMSEDTQSKEITVNIRPEKETVIEYEVGGQPVVSDE
jgi:hypothetical protein